MGRVGPPLFSLFKPAFLFFAIIVLGRIALRFWSSGSPAPVSKKNHPRAEALDSQKVARTTTARKDFGARRSGGEH